MDQDSKELAKYLFESHQRPIVKLNIGGVKIYIPKDDNTEVINKNLDILRNTLKFPRVEKRNVRSHGEFLQLERVVEVTKMRNLQNFGYRDKMGLYLHLEEALYLLEINRLEILLNNFPLNIQQAYNLFVDNKLTLNQYRTYKKLTSEGFKVQKYKNAGEEPPNKRIKSEDVVYDGIQNKMTEKVAHFFKELKKGAPQEIWAHLGNTPIYTCNSFKDKTKNAKYDVYLVEEEMDPKIGFYKERNQNLFGIISNDDIPFYQISRISLPCLIKQEDNK